MYMGQGSRILRIWPFYRPAQEAIQWANAEGLILGRTATTLVPSGTATRAEVATVLQRFIEHYA